MTNTELAALLHTRFQHETFANEIKDLSQSQLETILYFADRLRPLPPPS